MPNEKGERRNIFQRFGDYLTSFFRSSQDTSPTYPYQSFPVPFISSKTIKKQLLDELKRNPLPSLNHEGRLVNPVPIHGTPTSTKIGIPSNQLVEQVAKPSPQLIPSTVSPAEIAVPIITDTPILGTSEPILIYNQQKLSSLLKNESFRVRTFQNWPSIVVKPHTLARAGFFYFQDSDKVQCAFCFGILHKWQEGDNPFDEHRHHFYCCPFITGEPVGNIPIPILIHIDGVTDVENRLPEPFQLQEDSVKH